VQHNYVLHFFWLYFGENQKVQQSVTKCYNTTLRFFWLYFGKKWKVLQMQQKISSLKSASMQHGIYCIFYLIKYINYYMQHFSDSEKFFWSTEKVLHLLHFLTNVYNSAKKPLQAFVALCCALLQNWKANLKKPNNHQKPTWTQSEEEARESTKKYKWKSFKSLKAVIKPWKNYSFAILSKFI
jgi:hypothetical protein